MARNIFTAAQQTAALELQEQLWTWLEVTVPRATDGRVILGALVHQMAWIIAANGLEQSDEAREAVLDWLDETLRAHVDVIRSHLIQ